MGGDRLAKYGDREDQVEVHMSEIRDDEEAQLLHEGGIEQYELDHTSRHSHRLRDSPDPKPRRGWGRQHAPRCLLFLYGPDPPKVHTIKPILPSVQELPVRWFEKALPRPWQRVVLLVVFLVAWAVSLAVPLVLSKGRATDASGAVVRHIDCVDTLWRRNNECGVDGVDCRPFSNSSFAFRCPADCASVQVLNPHHVGPQDVNFRPLVIGGGSQGIYRGDSFLCGAAIHAGVVNDATGGCGVVTLVGEYYHYFASSQHGIDSIPFDSHFPLSFTVSADPAVQCTTPDPRWAVSLPLSILFTLLLSVLTTSASVLYFPTFLGIFTHVALVSDPPNLSSPSSTLLPSLVSHYAARLLPALFCAAVVYLSCARRALAGLTAAANLEKTLLWTLPFWLGALSNRTIEPLIPIVRLTPQDVSAQPGAAAALAVIIVLVAAVAAVQARALYLEARLPAYLALYLALLAGLAGLAALPGLQLRLHHYILALLLLPGTAAQTRLSLACQGLLLGLFVNGVARWGFAGIVQTADELRGDGALGSVLPELAGAWVQALGGTDGLERPGSRIWFRWKELAPPVDEAIQGISVLVNDVERFRGWFSERPVEGQVYAWTRREGGIVADEYFRFGFLTWDGRALDYTEAGTWFANGSWSQGATAV
ncbi:Cysteine-rich secretory protein LCCL domain-containing 2 [Madurella mycetomatis]|uniref:Cysteine-rich secretory protein LCCL domain-containing 2 n=1 Tax=Madurella mycetomatis TaxID=100816 RepID=A0A175VTN0_9PEZI|nr:Cysteine-rich secretory protein LCCL domain-containing 2 [Madurella mycetomatis]